MKTEEKISLPHQAYLEIKRRILDNELSPNVIMLEKELADLLGMSRTPVREALIRLSNEGLVEVRPRHGMRVLPLSAEDMIEIYQILTALETQAAEMVAEKGLNKEELALLNGTVDEMDSALAVDDLEGWSQADEKFHMQLVEFSGNKRLVSAVNNYFDQSHRARCFTLRLRPKPSNSNNDHRCVVAAIEARDPKKAAECHREHRQKSAEMLVKLLTETNIVNLY